MTSAVERTTIISPGWLEANINKKADQPLIDHGIQYVGEKTVGSFRALGALQKTLRLGSAIGTEAGFAPSSTLREFDKGLGIGVSAFGFPRLPSVTSEAIKSVSSLSQDDGISFSRKVVKAVRDLMDAISAYGFCYVFITGNPLARTVAQATEFVTDLSDLHISTSDYSKASELEAVATGEAKVALNHSKNYLFLRIVKAVASLACAILGYTMLVTGASLLHPIALTAIFLSATLIAITRDMYKEMGKYPVINFDREVQLV